MSGPAADSRNEVPKQAIRQSFERAAARYEQSAFLQREVARRLAEHLDEMKVQPQTILDAGCGTGLGLPWLQARFPEADVVGLDLAQAMTATLRQRYCANGLRGWLQRARQFFWPQTPRVMPVCADIEALPLRDDCVDMVWSSLTLQWVDLPRAFAEMNRVLKPGSLFLFATLGPDTLQELRAASQSVDDYAHVNRFIDMHDVGDALVHAGFANPVMEMEHITLTYAELRGVFADLKGIGAHTVLERRRGGLMGKSAWAALARNYEAFRKAGRLPATYEVIYGHAWAGTPRPQTSPDSSSPARADGRQVIEFKRWER